MAVRKPAASVGAVQGGGAGQPGQERQDGDGQEAGGPGDDVVDGRGDAGVLGRCRRPWPWRSAGRP